MSPRAIARLPRALLTLTVVLVLAMVPLSLGGEPLFNTVFYALLALSLATTGAFVATRHPAKGIEDRGSQRALAARPQARQEVDTARVRTGRRAAALRPVGFQSRLGMRSGGRPSCAARHTGSAIRL